MSLVEAELRYASVQKKPVMAVLTETTGSVDPTMGRLRQHLQHQLDEAVRTVTEIRDDVHPLLGQLAAFHACTRKYGFPIPNQIQREIRQTDGISQGVAEDLCNPQVAPTRINKLARQHDVYVPSVADLASVLEELEDFFGNWEQTARPVFSDRVFISYSRQDVDVAEDLQHQLSERGLEPWRDQQDLRTGDRFRDILWNEIEKSGAFVVLISENSADSDWVNDEVEHALEMEKRYGRDVYFILPVCLEGTPPDAIEALKTYDHLVLDPDDVVSGVEALVENLHERRRRAVERS